MGQPFLGAEQRDDFGTGVQLDPIPLVVPGCGRILKLGSIADRIDIVALVCGFSGHSIQNMLCRRDVWRADAQVHHMHPFGKLLFFQLKQFGENPHTEKFHPFGKFHLWQPLFLHPRQSGSGQRPAYHPNRNPSFISIIAQSGPFANCFQEITANVAPV